MYSKILLVSSVLLYSGIAGAQSVQQPSLRYDLAQVRYVDVDVANGSGFELGGSYLFENKWLVQGSLTDVGFDGDVESFTIEIGGGYVWGWQPNWDLVGSVRFTNISVDTPFGDADDDGFIFEGGTRGLLTPQFEVRGSVNHITVGDGDTYLEVAGDYYFTDQFAAGLALEFGGDVDVFSVGARWFFR